MESSTLLPKIHRKSMLPPRCSRPAWLNIEVNTVAHVEMSVGTLFPQPTAVPCSISSQCWPGCVISYGIAP
jgi:hypothetical protein